MTTQLVENKCDGGQWTCSPPKECCKQGCCFLFSSSIYKGSSSTSSLQPGSVFNPLFLGHWYFWLAVTATVAGILCACSLWRKHNQGSFCCKDSSNGRDERASEPDSNGSCYAPPQYSRCNSFHQAPPPYSEVTSKPDLYPLVISYNAEPVIKSNNSSTGYLMVQYFRNFIVRPVGSLSATSTIDSLSSSFLCNATNEANSIIPPPYSHMASLEDITTSTTMDNQLLLLPTTNINNINNNSTSAASQFDQRRCLPRSASSYSQNMEYHQIPQASPSIHSRLSIATTTPSIGGGGGGTSTTPTTPPQPTQQLQQRSSNSSSSSTSNSYQNNHQIVSITDNPCFDQNATTSSTKTSTTTNNILLLEEDEEECNSRGQRQGSTTILVPNEVITPLTEREDTSKTGRVESKCQIMNCDASAAVSSKINNINNNNNNSSNSKRIVTMQRHKLSKDDSESQDDDHNFSDLLNLSVCVPSNVVHHLENNPIQSSPHLQELQYSVTNSIGSDISSLANLGSPDSPPRATSPTVEMKELLDKIQQLPQQKSPIPLQLQNAAVDQQNHQKYSSGSSNNRNYFHKVRAKTLYMPLCDENATAADGCSAAKMRNIPNVFSRSWLSRSAPCTPSSNFVPNFTILNMNHHHQMKGSNSKNKIKISDGSPLLKEHAEESEDEHHNKD